jgi:alkylated DNA repair dioxygenase AlkB
MHPAHCTERDRPHFQRMQLSFLDARVAVVDEPSARIEYWPSVVGEETATAWFDALLGSVPWRADRRRMYDREVAVPRLRGHYVLDGGDDVPVAIRDALEAVVRVAPAPYTGVGLNLYRDGHDSVAMHHDRLDELVPGHPIAVLSLGAPRRMTISTKAMGGTRSIVLQPGSVIVMDHASQRQTLHGIPKTIAPVGARISLAFRVRAPTAPTMTPR